MMSLVNFLNNNLDINASATDSSVQEAINAVTGIVQTLLIVICD